MKAQEMSTNMYDTFFKIKEYAGMDAVPTSLVLTFVEDLEDAPCYNFTLTDDTEIEEGIDVCVRIYMANNLTSEEHPVIKELIEDNHDFRDIFNFMREQGIKVTRASLFAAICLKSLGAAYIDYIRIKNNLDDHFEAINRIQRDDVIPKDERNALFPHMSHGNYMVAYHLQSILKVIDIEAINNEIITFE